MSVVLIGFKSCGKSSTGRMLADELRFEFTDLDNVLEALYSSREGEKRTCREIFRERGEAAFRRLEADALAGLARRERLVLATGGGAPLHEPNRPLLQQIGRIIYLKSAPEVLFGRFQAQGMPAFMEGEPTLEHLRRLWSARDRVYASLAELTVEAGERPLSEIVAEMRQSVCGESA